MSSNKIRRRPGIAVTLAAALGVVIGCSSAEYERAAVSGQVTFQGEPVSEGSIVFFPVGDTKGVSAGADIVAGRYELAASEGPVVGTNRVEIQALRKTGRQIPDLMGDVSDPNRPLIDEKVNVLPPQFNVDSQLTREIAAGENQLDFEL